MAMWIFDRLQSMGEQRYLLRHLFVSSELTQLTLIMVRDIWKREQKDAFGWGGFGGNEGKTTMFFCVLLYLLKKGRIHLRCEDKAVVWNMAKMGFQLLELDWFSVYGVWHGLFLSVHAHECLSRKIILKPRRSCSVPGILFQQCDQANIAWENMGVKPAYPYLYLWVGAHLLITNYFSLLLVENLGF